MVNEIIGLVIYLALLIYVLISIIFARKITTNRLINVKLHPSFFNSTYFLLCNYLFKILGTYFGYIFIYSEIFDIQNTKESFVFKIILILSALALFIFLLLGSIRGLIIFLKYPVSKTFKETILDYSLFLGGNIIMFAGVNYIIYQFNPDSYSSFVFTNWFHIAFEFIYYSFSVSITYAGETLVPVSILAKSLAMLQIIVFYIVLGSGIMDVINSKGDSVNILKDE